jgi:hypothetical protein
MPSRHVELPKTGYAIEIDGILKSQFATKKGAGGWRRRTQAPLPEGSHSHLRCRPADEVRSAGIARSFQPTPETTDGAIETPAETAYLLPTWEIAISRLSSRTTDGCSS